MSNSTYAIAIGSNRRGRHGSPADAVRAAIAAVGGVVAASAVVETPPLGPSLRRFANAAVLVASTLEPPDMLARLKAIERAFGRRRGQRWGARVIDLDIVLWSGSVWRGPGLNIPHVAFRQRGFVLAPLLQIAPDWRDPLSGATIRQLVARLAKVDRTPCDP